MLQQLHIQNFALIEETSIELKEGLTVITGETGAGKSILLGALGLTLGNRADISLLHDKTKKCIVEARFAIGSYHLNAFFERHELDVEEITTVRREITPEGKSRAFINDTPVTLNVLKELGENLIDIHSQHETLLLKETTFQFALLDAFAGTNMLLSDYKKKYTALHKLHQQLKDLTAQELQAKKELDYFQFQFNELEEANVTIGDQKRLEEESETLENAELIKSNLVKSWTMISEGDETVLSALALVKQQLQGVTKFGTHFQELYERLQSVMIELKELANDINDREEQVVYNAARLEEVNTQLDQLNRLFKKHGVNSEEALLGIKHDIEAKLHLFSSLEYSINQVQKELASVEKQCQTLALTLSQKRQLAISSIEQHVKRMLSHLSMTNAQFKIDLKQKSDLSLQGIDTVSFLFTANKGSDVKALHKTASGGELSRLMLCLKSLLAEHTALPTIIFDEIDTGVSGEVASKIGTILNDMGKNMQVIVITHLPQLASKGQHHLYVHKSDSKHKTISNIKCLTPEERISEIAKMLSADKPTEIALQNAKELLNV